MMAEPVVTFSKSDTLGTITLDRPPANSYEIGFVSELDAALQAAQDDATVKVVILRSALEKFFSGGADIKAFMANSTTAKMEMIRSAHAALDRMAASPKIFIAMIQGHAMGGGLEMALACDLRFAAQGSYQIGLPEVTLGMLPGNCGNQRLPSLIGSNKALEMMLTGDTVTPEEALERGLINRLYAPDKIVEQTEIFAKKLAQGASKALSSIKQAVYGGSAMNLKDGLSLELDLAELLFDTEDADEVVHAFTEKRPPVFKGRWTRAMTDTECAVAL